MTTRQRNLMLLVGALATAGLAAFLFAPTMQERSASQAIPDGAFLLVTVDLARLRASPLAREISALRDVSEVTQECGFDPLARARAVAIGVPEKPDGVFGLAVTTDLAEPELLGCAQRVMSARSATARITKRGSWTDVEQEGILVEATRAKIAHRDGAPLLIARGDYLATMKAAVDGTAKRAQDSAAHASLRKVMQSRLQGDALLVATAVLPKSVRDRVMDEVNEADSETKKVTMAAILSVKAVGLGVTAHGESLDVLAELDCETEAACGVVRDFIDRKRKELADKPAARLVGVGTVLEALHIEVRGASLDLSVSAPEAELARALRAVLQAAFSPQHAP